MTVESTFTGLDGVGDYFRAFPDRTRRAARLAINRVIAREGMKEVQDEMYAQVAFPKGYLKGDRLAVSKYATESNLEGVILARKRATSLARFAAPGTPLGSRKGSSVTVQVKRGSRTVLRNAWLVRLRRGASMSEDNFNVSLCK